MSDARTAAGKPPRRADARRNAGNVLEAAAAVFVTSGVEAPIREIAARAGVGTATIYRHYPTRADLILAVYRRQVEALAEAGPALLAGDLGPHRALVEWIDRFVDFVITKQGLASVLQSDEACYDPLHAYFLERLGPVCTQLLEAAAEAGEIVPGQDAYELMRGVGSLCAGAGSAAHYDARHLVNLLVNGLRRS
ncbi:MULTISPECIES: TetR/AcrR family transcriptional regulator [unclassified Amycolatopsis]|uniref:TetR/AcrR family transcriptional regulator n=1 Tax=unclassified Amycolatopsis TaxID=2618356 RepID=UPI002875BB7C|nr:MULTISPECIES: TetR/AcrR family transcriptional regulator [unclassified Amycolatopsis]MDS0134266.1 TetR/AcrR family transcriptional regulator [Amycolatopsis sp. 505]MDS0146793.1 TetR/AcrR family transcriptional regulator [Amycolatopsis sp. CM201R]